MTSQALCQTLSRRRAAAFTLVELLVTVAVVAIVLALAAPSFSEFFANQNARRMGQDIYAALVAARSEAIKRNTSVSLVHKGDGWGNGWFIADPADPLDTSKYLLEQDPLRGWNLGGGLTITGPASVQFGRSGRISGAAVSFAISSTDYTGQDKRCISVDPSGRPRIERKSSC
jgi:type IV fimbrial biogenesis protein FimT